VCWAGDELTCEQRLDGEEQPCSSDVNCIRSVAARKHAPDTISEVQGHCEDAEYGADCKPFKQPPLACPLLDGYTAGLCLDVIHLVRGLIGGAEHCELKGDHNEEGG